MPQTPKTGRISDRPPPQGWEAPRSSDETADLGAIIALIELIRRIIPTDAVPPELNEQLRSAVRELLVALKALIEWYLERIEHGQTTDPVVNDIPIE